MEISRVVYSTEKSEYQPSYTPDVVFARRETGNLAMQILTPIGPDFPPDPNRKPSPLWQMVHEQRAKEAKEEGRKPPEQKKDPRRFPLIVHVPGSGWGGADGHGGVVQMVEFAKRGFVVASISYRGTYKDDVRYPAAVQDTKEAIRYLRANADIYHIDTKHVALIGDSSGGHTVAAAALTGDEPRFNIGEHLDQTTAVNACCIFYGPNDLLNLVPDRIAEGKKLRPLEGEYPFEAWEIFKTDFLENPKEMLADASPINYITKDKKLPAFLFLQGEEDAIIPMAQGLRFCQRVRDCGGRSEFVKIAAAGHGNGCWNEETRSIVANFFKAYI